MEITVMYSDSGNNLYTDVNNFSFRDKEFLILKFHDGATCFVTKSRIESFLVTYPEEVVDKSMLN